MSKYNHFEMCEKIFGQQYKWNEQKHDYEPYSRTDMWNKLIEQNKTITDLEAKLAESKKKYKKAYQEGLLQKQFDKDMEIAELKQQLAEAEEHIDNLELQLREQYQLVDEKDEQLAEKTLTIEQINKAFIGNRSLWKGKYERANQDKISFAVEQLLDIKEEVFGTREIGIIFDIPPVEDAFDAIENKIKQLKENNV